MIPNTPDQEPEGVRSPESTWWCKKPSLRPRAAWSRSLPADQFPTEGIPARGPRTSATYFNKVYAYPIASNAGLLFYRKDLCSTSTACSRRQPSTR